MTISIHAPPRGATGYIVKKGEHAALFQFTPLREGRRAVLRVVFFYFVFQFTPLREGRQEELMPRCPYCISIHAPPRGATAERRRLHPRDRHFNSRPSARGDFCGFSTTFALQISIHAPPRGATRRCAGSHVRGRTHFNSRPSARGDLASWSHSRRTHPFQFTPLREGRRGQSLNCTPSVHFNSRPSARGDRTLSRSCQNAAISIHAPPRGATFPMAGVSPTTRFQFTPLREGRLGFRVDVLRLRQFQFTPLREGRRAGAR